MSRARLRLVGCAAWLFSGAILVFAGPEDDQKIENALKVKAALSKGCDALRCGQYREAANVLEVNVLLIGANREYLAALREAYEGLIRELKQHGQESEVYRYQRRLSALDPGAQPQDVGSASPPPPAGKTTAEQDPAPRIGTEPHPVQAVPFPGGKPAVEPELDPFSDANSVQSQQARALTEQADRAFLNRSYADACKLYEQAFGLNNGMEASYKDRWAYCKLHGVATLLNQPRPTMPPQQMEREIRLALSLAPKGKYDNFGNKLLQRIQSQPAVQGGAERSDGEGTTEVRHLPDKVKGWSVCETTNFRIFSKQSAEQAERAARAAESARAQSARRWFGEVPPAWSPRCDLYLHLNKHDYSQETGQPLDCPGHSTIAMETGSDQVRSRRIDLHCDDLNMIYGVVPHEVTHVVLAGRFGVQHLPRWADEGMAVLSEPRDRVERHLRNLPQHQRDRQLFAIADLMQYNDYPEGKYIGVFYAQSVSLVDYLCQQKGGTQTFARFLRDGLRGGYEPALRQHYGISSFLDLQNRWQAARWGPGQVSRSAGSEGQGHCDRDKNVLEARDAPP